MPRHLNESAAQVNESGVAPSDQGKSSTKPTCAVARGVLLLGCPVRSSTSGVRCAGGSVTCPSQLSSPSRSPLIPPYLLSSPSSRPRPVRTSLRLSRPIAASSPRLLSKCERYSSPSLNRGGPPTPRPIRTFWRFPHVQVYICGCPHISALLCLRRLPHQISLPTSQPPEPGVFASLCTGKNAGRGIATPIIFLVGKSTRPTDEIGRQISLNVFRTTITNSALLDKRPLRVLQWSVAGRHGPKPHSNIAICAHK